MLGEEKRKCTVTMEISFLNRHDVCNVCYKTVRPRQVANVNAAFRPTQCSDTWLLLLAFGLVAVLTFVVCRRSGCRLFALSPFCLSFFVAVLVSPF